MSQPRFRDIEGRSTPPNQIRRLRNFFGSYIDTKVGHTSRGIGESTTRRVEEPLVAREALDANDGAITQEEERLVLYPTYARIKPHLLHMTHQHTATSEHGLRNCNCANDSEC
jgi:hypothetical protein